VFAAISLIAACGNGKSDADAFLTRDSAGITIAESSGPAWNARSGWTVAPQPFLTIGVAEGDTTQQLFRVTDAARLPSDTIVIVNGGTAEVRWYEPGGRFVRAVGRTGGGPGEFSEYGPGAMCMLPENRILVSDPIQQRANIFSTSGEFVDVLRIRVDAAFPSVQGCFNDGTVLGWRAVGATDRIPGRTYQSAFIWSRLSSDGSVLAELARFPGNAQYLLDQGDGTATYHTIPFTVRPSAVAGADRFYVTAGGEPVIQRHRLDGTLEAIIRWTPAVRIRSADVYERYRAHTIESQDRPEQRAHWAKFFGLDLEFPELVASVRSLEIDELGSVWAERYRLPWDSVPTWDVFDARGRWLGEVILPARLQVYQMGRDFVLGLSRDEMGVERIQLHQLKR
jgi:hypothetical protein